MPTLQIDDFASGVDLRKSNITAPAGTLRDLTNAVITSGGEIEKRKTLTSLGTLPASLTFGLSFLNKELVVFGLSDAATVEPLLPAFVRYEQLATVGPSAPDRLLDVQTFAGKLYVVLRYVDGSVVHYYDGAEVTDAAAQGETVRAHKSKLFAADGTNLKFSAVRDPMDWSVGAGNGIIDVTTEDAGETELVGLEEYYGALAVFGRTSVQIWAMDPDPALSQITQVLGNTGLVTRNAVARFGSGDVLFLSDTGIRSLRARDIQSAAAVNDVGAPVDKLIAVKRATLTQPLADKITAVVDPLTGRYWMVWGAQAFVLTAFPNSKVSAWSVFDFYTNIDYITTAGSRLAVRSGEELFVYGSVADPAQNPFDPNTPIGSAAENYDASAVVVETPFMDASRPAVTKYWSGMDVTCTGTWEVYVCPEPPAVTVSDPNPTPAWVRVATLDRPTWGRNRVPIDMEANHLAIRMVSVGTGPATLASVALHHDLGDES